MRYAEFEFGQEQIVSNLIWTVFNKYEAPDYPPEGIKTFKNFIAPNNIKHLAEEGNRIYCCFNQDRLVGVLALRSPSHISLLFVDEEYHRQGIARTLLSKSLEAIAVSNPEAEKITVNSSPFAEGIYARMGFTAADGIKQQDGIIFVPMVRQLKV